MNCSVQSQSYHHKYGSVVILEQSTQLTKVLTTEGRDFWVPTESLETPEQFAKRLLVAQRRAPDAVEARCKRDNQMRVGIDVSCTRKEFVDRLLNTDLYILRLDATEEGVEIAQAEYINWTGESFPEDLIHLEDERPQARRWRFDFVDSPGCLYPFPVIMCGSQETPYARLFEGARGLYLNGKISMHYAEEVERLIRLGLRAK